MTLVDYLVLAGAEALIGLTLGLGVLLLFSGMHVAGQIISQMSGMQLADVFDPGFDANVPAFSQLLSYVDDGRVRDHRRSSQGDRSLARHVCLAAGGAGGLLAIDRPRP